jgi:hypothetical protein
VVEAVDHAEALGSGERYGDDVAEVADLGRYKEEYYPDDPRVIVVCGMREDNVHVEWTGQ